MNAKVGTRFDRVWGGNDRLAADDDRLEDQVPAL